jgi:alanine racemase
MPSSTMIRRTRVEIDLAAVVANARTIRAVTGTDPGSMTRDQLRRFRDVDRAVTATGAPPRVRHAAHSSGALLFPEARWDLVMSKRVPRTYVGEPP